MIKEAKKVALEKLKGNWLKAVGAMLICQILIIICSTITLATGVLGAILTVIVGVCISYGIQKVLFNLFRNGTVMLGEIFNGFKKLPQILMISLNVFGRLLFWFILIAIAMVFMLTGIMKSELLILGTILLIISLSFMVIKMTSYSMIYFIFIENEDSIKSWKDCNNVIKKSIRITKGKIGTLIWLPFTFIGWALLSSITLGIGMLWLGIYMAVTRISIYSMLNENNKEDNNEVNTNTISKKAYNSAEIGVIIVAMILAICGISIVSNNNLLNKDNIFNFIISNNLINKNVKVQEFTINKPLEFTNDDGGKYTLTIEQARTTQERNEFSEINPNKVIFLDYSYENVSSNDNVYVFSSHFKIIDDEGNIVNTYPVSDETRRAQEIPKGAKSKASEAYALTTDSRTVKVLYYKNMFNSNADAQITLDIK